MVNFDTELGGPFPPDIISVAAIADRAMRSILSLPRTSHLYLYVRQCVELTRRQCSTPGANRLRTPWPMPPPFPGELGHADLDLGPPFDVLTRGVRRMMNVSVMTLSWMAVGRPPCCPAAAAAGHPLTEEQLDTLGRLLLPVQRAADEGRVEVRGLGRAAGKIIDMNTELANLERQSATLEADIAQYAAGRAPRVPGRSTDRWVVEADEGELAEAAVTARALDPERLTFAGRPSFDPRPLYDCETREAYEHPETLELEDPPKEIPVAHVRGRKQDVLGVFKKLDAGGRIELVANEEASQKYASGLFAVAKDLDRDRLIMDSRPSNCRERALLRWTRLMASASSLVHLVLPEGCQLFLSADDFVDYYYEFIVSARELAVMP